MPLVPLIILALVFLVGAVALAIGHKGWHWATVTAAWLVLLTSIGAFFLVGMVGKREQEWRRLVGAYQGSIARERDALVAQGGANLRPDPTLKSLSTLEDERDRWSRVRDRINTWRGRHWDDALFVPPADGRPGSVTINGLENSTIHPGAEFYLFDATPIEQGGRFLGAFRVETVDKNVFAVSAISAPDAADQKALAQPRDGKVIVYEDLPVDRSFAFYRTPVPAAPADGSTDAPAPASTDGTVPAAAKTDPGEMLRHLERKLEELRLHETALGDAAGPAAEAGGDAAGAVPAGDPAADPAADPTGGTVVADGDPPPGATRTVPDPSLSETPPLGVRWARVVFASPFDYTWPDGTVTNFAAGEVLPALPADQVAVLRERGADFTSTWSIPPGLYWAKVEFRQAHTLPRAQGEALEFAEGAKATFDLDSAKALAEQGVVTIESVVFRRPLSDGNVALRGAGVQNTAGRPLAIDVNGLVVIRRILEEEKRAIDSSIAQLRNAKESTQSEIALRREEAGELEDDLGHWATDVAESQRTAEAFAARVSQARRELSGLETAIVALGREFTAGTSALVEAIDQTAPPPSNPPLPAAAAR